MWIGAVTWQGHMIFVPVGSQDIEMTLRMMDHEAASLVHSILLALATTDPKWRDAHETVREVLR